MLDPKYFHADGRRKTFDERRQAERDAAKAAQLVATELERRQAKEVSHDQQVLASHQNRLAELKGKLRWTPEHDKPGLLRRINMLQQASDDLASKMAEQSRVEMLANDESAKNAREFVDAFIRTPPKGADTARVAVLKALADSNNWESGRALALAVFAEAESIESAALEFAKNESAKANEAVLLAEMNAANAKVQECESGKRLAEIRSNLE